MFRATAGFALRGAWRHWGLLAVLAVALAVRLLHLRWFKAFPPGDVFNFISIARSLPDGAYPPGEKRLPFYPLLVLAARSALEWETAALVVAVTASLGALVALYALGRTLGLSKTALAAMLLVFQTHPQFLVASTRGYADTTAIALLAAALTVLLRARTWRGALGTGLLFGAASLTRYEGLLAALTALPLWLLFPRQASRRIPLLAMGIFAISLLPYVVLSAVNDRPVLGAGYLAEAQQTDYGARDVRAVAQNFGEIWRRVGLIGAWRIPVALVREISGDPLATPRILTARLSEPGEPLAFLAFVGLLALLIWKRWRELLLLVSAYAAATLAPAWYEPYPRYDAFILPLLVFLGASGLTGFQRLLDRGTRAAGQPGRFVRLAAGVLLLFFVSGFWVVSYAGETRNRQQKHNGRDYAYYRAIHAVRALEGRMAFDADPDIARLYFGDDFMILRNTFRGSSGSREAVERLRAAGVRRIILPASREPAYPFLNAEGIVREAEYSWPRGDGDTSRATIYRVLPPS